MKIRCKIQGAVLVSSLLLIDAAPLRADVPTFTLTIKDHRFQPAELSVPANEKLKLVIQNEDPTPEEFESYDLNREKIVTSKGSISVFIGPLKPGSYQYFGDFNPDVAKGTIIAGSDTGTAPLTSNATQ